MDPSSKIRRAHIALISISAIALAGVIYLAAKQRRPSGGEAAYLLAMKFGRMPRIPEAVQMALREEQCAEQLLPGDPRVEYDLSCRYMSLNQPEKAARAFAAGLARSPGDVKLARGALAAYLAIGDTTHAAPIAEQLQHVPAPRALDTSAPPAPAAASNPNTVGRFADVTAAAGLDYNFEFVGGSSRTILETIGNGCAFLDYNNDGNLDILLVGPMLKLYEGDGHGHFTDVTVKAGLDKVHGYFLGVAVADFDNDGYDDILLTGFNRVALLHNEHGMRFTDVTAKSGLQQQGWWTSAAWGDIDGDGKLDLYICRYAKYPPELMPLCVMSGTLSGCGPKFFANEYGVLYHNDGAGHFHDITAEWGARGHGKGLGAAFADFDHSGRQSLFVANDQEPSDLYLNVGGRFQNIGKSSGVSVRDDGQGYSGMGVDWGDYDNDGLLDLCVMDFQWEDKRVFHNDGSHQFSQQYRQLGMNPGSYPWVAFGVHWLDYDNDGYLDMIYCNGHTDDLIQSRRSDLRYLEPTMLYHNEKGRRFTDDSGGLIGPAHRSILGRGLAVGDFDNDGKIDALVIDSAGSPLLLHNETQAAGNWLEVSLVGVKCNRDAYGATVTCSAGGLRQTRVCHADGSYLSSSDKRVHLGLGAANSADLVVKWPDGTIDRISRVAANQGLTVIEGRGRVL